MIYFLSCRRPERDLYSKNSVDLSLNKTSLFGNSHVVFSGAKTQSVMSWKIWEEMAQASRNRKSMYCFFVSVNLILNFLELFDLEILEFYT